jgi:alkylhydroperoxidase/carboxymuconolactone decarboxylase family protein YurZ
MNSDALKRYAEAGLPVRPWHQLLADHRPDALAEFLESTEKALAPTALPEKTKLLIVIAVDAVDAWPGLKSFINRAYELGTTTQELIDVCVLTGWLKGPHALNYGLTTLHQVIEERRGANKPVP